MQIFWFSFLMIFNLIGSYNKHTQEVGEARAKRMLA